MSDEKEPTEAAPEGESVYVVDWTREPLALYANAAAVDINGEAVGLVFLDATPNERRVAEVGGRRRMVAVPVASIRMAPGNFLHMLQALNEQWNQFAKTLKVPPGAEPPPTFEAVRREKKP